jgi:hypothetical protein
MVHFARMVAKDVERGADAEADDCASNKNTEGEEIVSIGRGVPRGDEVVCVECICEEGHSRDEM